MKCNMGKADRIIRVIISLIIIGLGVFYKSWLGAFGLIPLGTALTGWCPMYVPFSFATCKKE